MKKLLALALLVAIAAAASWNYLTLPLPAQWSEQEVRLIQSLSLAQLADLPPDPSNAVADDEDAAIFGQRLFFDTRLSANGQVACATCHVPERMFSDGLPLAIGMDIGPRHTPGLVGLSHSPWFYWDGRKDSQWAQALAPLEAGHEHGMDRLQITRLVLDDPDYARRYQQIFETPSSILIPDNPVSASPLGTPEQQASWAQLDPEQQLSVSRVFANLGKAIAAYERKIMPGRTRFDDYADALSADASTRQSDFMNPAETAGLALFIDKGQCVSCHNGPLLSNHEFHNTGVLALSGQLPPMGRYDGIRTARQDEFNCLGEFSDADASECIELRFARDENDLVGAQKTPTLRNVDLTAPYMHGGQLATLAEVMEHYNEAPVSMLNHNEAKPLGLRPAELRQLEAFMHTLTAPLATDEKWLQSPHATN